MISVYMVNEKKNRTVQILHIIYKSLPKSLPKRVKIDFLATKKLSNLLYIKQFLRVLSFKLAPYIFVRSN